MNRDFERRWKKISEVQIPPIPRSGFTGNVLEREIWHVSSEKKVEYPAYLVRESTNEKILLNKEKLVLGKSSEADYKLEGNPAISRTHTAFLYRDGQVYIEDLGSSNHTWIEGCKVESRQLLQNCDHIRIADEEFVFYIGNKG